MLRFERRWTERILESFAPIGSEGLAPEAGEVDLLAAFDALRSGGSRPASAALRAAVWMVTFAPAWTLRAPTTFAGLSTAERQDLLEKLLEHRVLFVREAAFLMKTVACMALFESDSVRARSRYDGVAAETPRALRLVR